MNPTLFDEPRARGGDPSTSHEAAATVKPGNAELIYAIRWWVSKQREPKTAFQIADALYGPRWQHDTVRSAVSRAGLEALKDRFGKSKPVGGRRCTLYVISERA